MSFGSSTVHIDAVVPSNQSVYGGPTGVWQNTYTINPTNPGLNGTSATARFTYHASGDISWNGRQGWTYYNIRMEDNFVNNPNIGVTPGTQPLSNFNTFTYDRPFTFGQPLQVTVNHGAFLNVDQTGAGTSGSGTISVTLRDGGFAVIDSQGNPLSYSASSSAGNAQGTVLPASTSYSGVNLTNDTNNNHVGSTVALLDGTSSSDTYVQAAFTAPPPPEAGAIPVSDAVEVNGTKQDPVVIQLSFSPALAQSIFGSLSKLGLGWFDPAVQIVRNAVLGNSSGVPHFVNGPYDPAHDFQLGYFGIDTAKGVVWAVVNHNSQFVVTDLDTLQVPSVWHLANSHLLLKFAGVANAVNHVEATPTLSPASWTTVATVTAGATGTVSFEDTNAGSATQQFYRVSSP